MALLIDRTFANILVQGAFTLATCSASLAVAPAVPLHATPVYPPMALYPASSNSSAPQTLMQRGQRYSASGQYAQAEECFRQSAVEHPRDPYVHYYLANVLVYLKKHPQAMEEYNLAFRLDPYGPVSGYCRKALVTYRMHGAAPIAESQTSEPISAAERLGIRLPDEVDHGSVVKVIRTQAEREKVRHRQFAESIAATMVRGGETRAQVIERNAHDAINETLNSPVRYRPFENPFMAIENRRLQIEQMRKEAEEAAKQERAVAAEKSDSYKRWSLEHEFSLDEIASNLEAQMLTKTLPGSARLRPEGTGLFVRYYGRSGADVEVHNSVAHFTDHRAFESPDDSGVGDEEESGKLLRRLSNDRPTPVRESTVRGAVIK